MFKKYKPLLILFAYLLTMSYLIIESRQESFMLTLMGLFFLIFSYFKVIHLKEFVMSFARYDPLAKLMPKYGYIYPFIEVTLGILFLLGAYVEIASLATIIVLFITTSGILMALRKGEILECACLGEVFNLPLSKVTVIENSAMILMAVIQLV